MDMKTSGTEKIAKNHAFISPINKQNMEFKKFPLQRVGSTEPDTTGLSNIKVLNTAVMHFCSAKV